MIIPDRKKAAMLIVSKLGKGGGTTESEQKPEEGAGDDTVALASDLLHAIDQKSPAAVADAFRALFLALGAEPQAEGEGTEEGE